MKPLMFFNNMPLVISLLLTLAIASTEVPLWASSFSLLFIVWRFLYEKYNVAKLSKKITPVFGLMFFIIVYIQHRSILGQEESITILIGLTSITILNYELERDLLFLVLLGFLMLVLKSVFSLDFIWVLPALISYFGLWITLMGNSKINKYHYVWKTVLRSAPALIILFIAFPRFVLFQVNRISKPFVQSGFTEELTPGRFNNMALNDEMVFRVQFPNTVSIDSSQLYWRGSVLNFSSGFVWTKGLILRKTSGYILKENKPSIKYTIMQEPLNMKNIFVLEQPARIKKASEPVFEMNHSLYSLVAPPTQIVQVDAEATLEDSFEQGEDTSENKKYLKIPELPPKTKEWVEQTKAKFSTQEERLKALTQFFEKPGFIYTLKPDLYTNLDEFLFSKKKGYCEHYAAAYATMARGLGVPARVVIGYQGGSYNELSDFWKISQRDAHAWVEVGINNVWKRIDPTGMVSPLRLALGSADFFALSEADQLLFSKDKKVKSKTTFRQLYLATMSVIDSLNYNWTLFLLNYDLQAQLDIIKNIKLSGFFIFFVIFLALILGFYYYKNYYLQDRPKHKLQKLFYKIESWAAGQNIQINKNDTPLEVLDAIQARFPELQNFINKFKSAYVDTVYRENQNIKNDRELKTEWNRLVRLKKRAT